MVNLAARSYIYNIPKGLSISNQKIHKIELHGFGNASKDGCCSAIYQLVKHADGTTSGLLTAKSRISKGETSIHQLELIAGHMVANSLENVRKALKKFALNSRQSKGMEAICS